MKTKPVLIILSCAVVLLCGFLLIRSLNTAKPEKGEIAAFLNKFTEQVKAGNTDSLMNYFETGQKRQSVVKLINVLSGKTGLNGKTSPLFKITFDPQNHKIIYSSSKITVIQLPVRFFADSLAEKRSFITVTIHKTIYGEFKIVKMKTEFFLKDYSTYASLVRLKTTPIANVYSAITLKSFKVAAELKKSYDSVLWFDHVGDKTYYYVIKGKLNDRFYWATEKPADYTPTYKMGLVNPFKKEIIPPEYDLIHNVNGTIAGLIEVEKNGKRGFYNLQGAMILPTDYDQIFPLVNDENLALLRKGDDYFYLKSDTTTTNKIPDLKIAEMLPKIKTYGTNYRLSGENTKNIMEYNDYAMSTTIVITPSYLVDMHILPSVLNFQDPLRKLSPDEVGDGDGSLTIDIKFDGEKNDDGNWFKTVFYSLYNDYLGARSGLYEGKNVLIVDKKRNRIMGFDADSYYGKAEGGGALSGLCNENSFRAVNDTLFEFRTTSEFDQDLLNGKHLLSEGPYYHYLYIKNGKLVALPNERLFGCTKYVKLDESYLGGCYVINQIQEPNSYHKGKGVALTHTTLEILQFMKNEIYASYGYKFKTSEWNDRFEGRFNRSDTLKVNVDDSLTIIDKYNINWLNQKIKDYNPNTFATTK